mmetsp:Transcript_106137/g.297099  ORF Transcript_106137/g.297099 Transcript_106137/m.297099 type:complete len:84 (-) Transcript_106137:28-279(-)
MRIRLPFFMGNPGVVVAAVLVVKNRLITLSDFFREPGGQKSRLHQGNRDVVRLDFSSQAIAKSFQCSLAATIGSPSWKAWNQG